MAIVFADRVKDTSTTTGTGNFTLAGSPPSGFVSFDSTFGHAGNHFYYVIDGGANWEVGEGHLSASTTLVRDTVLASSNSGAAVSFPAGTKTVYADVPATHFQQRAYLTSTFSKLNSTFSNVTDLTLNLLGGRTYRITGHLKLQGNGGSGLTVLDFNGGTATLTAGGGFALLYDQSLGTANYSDIAYLNDQIMGNDLALVASLNLTFKIDAGGTFIPRFAQQVTDGGTASELMPYSTIIAEDIS